MYLVQMTPSSCWLALARASRVGVAVSVVGTPATAACVELCSVVAPLLTQRGFAVALAIAYVPQFSSILLPYAYRVEPRLLRVEVCFLILTLLYLRCPSYWASSLS